MYHEAPMVTISGLIPWYLRKETGWVPIKETSKGVLIGHCPFHQERTPSFYIYPEPDAHVHCYGCTLHADFLRLLAILSLGIEPDALALPGETYTERARILEDFRKAGGSADLVQIERQHRVARPIHPILAIPGPLHRKTLYRFMEWSHEQLLRSPRGMDYSQHRGASISLLKQSLMLGYMPQELPNRAFSQFCDLCAPTEQQLQQERDWYLDHDSELSREDLPFLQSKEALRVRLGIFTTTGRLRLSGRVLFFSQNRFCEPVSYQARLAQTYVPDRARKYLKPPDLRSFPFQMVVPHAARKATVVPESPVGVVVNASMEICERGVAMGGSGIPYAPFWEQLQGPFLVTGDNDPHFKNGKLLYPGKKLTDLYMDFFEQTGKPAYRLLPELLCAKDFDSWAIRRGREVILKEIDQVLDLGNWTAA